MYQFETQSDTTRFDMPLSPLPLRRQIADFHCCGTAQAQPHTQHTKSHGKVFCPLDGVEATPGLWWEEDKIQCRQWTGEKVTVTNEHRSCAGSRLVLQTRS